VGKRCPMASGRTGFNPCNAVANHAAPRECCQASERCAGDSMTTVATASSSTAPRARPKTPPSRRSTGCSGVACTSSRTRRETRAQTSSASTKAAKKAMPWLSAPPGTPNGT
jgi:hypothetical protein